MICGPSIGGGGGGSGAGENAGPMPSPGSPSITLVRDDRPSRAGCDARGRGGFDAGDAFGSLLGPAG